MPRIPTDGRKLILSIDDEPAILFTREKILEMEGYEVLSAANGVKALQMFDTHPVNLVLLDFVMPGMDGGMVVQKMKGRKPFVPVIMVSANEVPEEITACADCYVAKAEGPEYLLREISRLLETTSNSAPSRAAQSF